MKTHTPGPWQAVNWTCHAPTTVKAADGTVVADTSGFGRHTDDCIPDARLIAAAPELLESLQHKQACAVCAQGSWEDCDGGKKALAAIAKATGGQS